MTSTFIYRKNNHDYQVHLTKKKVKMIRYRYRDGDFYITAPYLINKDQIVKGLDKFFDRLTKENPHCSGLTDDYVYLLGKKFPLQSEGKINFSDGSVITYESKEELEKKLKKWFLKYVTVLHRRREKEMRTVTNTVRVRKMYTRYGSNSIGKRSITYSTILMHYSKDVIDSVIVHELAHCFISNHSDKFYKIVYKYCPNYDYLHTKLKKGIYSDDSSN